MSDASRERFGALLERPDPDLAEANLLIAVEAYPRLDLDRWLREVDLLADAAVQTGGGVDGVVRALRARELSGDRSTYDDPRNSFLNEVLDRRVGLPIALAALTVAVGARVGVSLAPIALPGHVIVGDLSGPQPRYLDAFDSWHERTEDELGEIVRMTSGVALTREQLQPAPPKSVIRRMLVNLTGSYMRRELYTDARWSVELQAIVHPDDPGIAEQLQAFDGLL